MIRMTIRGVFFMVRNIFKYNKFQRYKENQDHSEAHKGVFYTFVVLNFNNNNSLYEKHCINEDP